nr:PREDICTED: uncharacterized protein LOC109452717 [Rhinolophus sinicus]
MAAPVATPHPQLLRGLRAEDACSGGGTTLQSAEESPSARLYVNLSTLAPPDAELEVFREKRRAGQKVSFTPVEKESAVEGTVGSRGVTAGASDLNASARSWSRHTHTLTARPLFVPGSNFSAWLGRSLSRRSPSLRRAGLSKQRAAPLGFARPRGGGRPELGCVRGSGRVPTAPRPESAQPRSLLRALPRRPLCVTKFGKNMDPSQSFHVCSQLPAEKAKGSLPDAAILKFILGGKRNMDHSTEGSVLCVGVEGSEEALKTLKENPGRLLKKINSLKGEAWLKDFLIFINLFSQWLW